MKDVEVQLSFQFSSVTSSEDGFMKPDNVLKCLECYDSKRPPRTTRPPTRKSKNPGRIALKEMIMAARNRPATSDNLSKGKEIIKMCIDYIENSPSSVIVVPFTDKKEEADWEEVKTFLNSRMAKAKGFLEGKTSPQTAATKVQAVKLVLKCVRRLISRVTKSSAYKSTSSDGPVNDRDWLPFSEQVSKLLIPSGTKICTKFVRIRYLPEHDMDKATKEKLEALVKKAAATTQVIARFTPCTTPSTIWLYSWATVSANLCE